MYLFITSGLDSARRRSSGTSGARGIIYTGCPRTYLDGIQQKFYRSPCDSNPWVYVQASSSDSISSRYSSSTGGSSHKNSRMSIICIRMFVKFSYFSQLFSSYEHFSPKRQVSRHGKPGRRHWRWHDPTWNYTYWYDIASGFRNRAAQEEKKSMGRCRDRDFGETQKGGLVIADEVDSAASLWFVASGVSFEKV